MTREHRPSRLHSLLWLDADRSSLSEAAARSLSACLVRLARDVRAVPVTPSIAATAARLGTAFPSDPFDRIICATAIEQGWQVATRDQRMHDYPADRAVAVW